MSALASAGANISAAAASRPAGMARVFLIRRLYRHCLCTSLLHLCERSDHSPAHAYDRDVRRLEAIVAILSLAVLLAGCGSKYTKSDFVARADGICTNAVREIRSLNAPTAAAGQELHALSRYLAKVLPIVQSEASQIRALKRTGRRLDRARPLPLGASRGGRRIRPARRRRQARRPAGRRERRGEAAGEPGCQHGRPVRTARLRHAGRHGRLSTTALPER